MRKIGKYFMIAVALGGLAMFEKARWPAYKALAHAWVTGGPIVPATISTSTMMSGFAIMVLATLGAWLVKRQEDRRDNSPPTKPQPPRPSLRLVS